MPYSHILKRILEQVEGAIAVGFADHEGESVQMAGPIDPYTHRLHLAYQGIALQNVLRIHESSVSHLIVIYANASFVVKPLKGNYYLVLMLQHRRALHKALRALDEYATELNGEL